MRADSSRSSDSTAGDGGGDCGDFSANASKATPAGRARRSSFQQHSGSDDDPTVLMCGCLGPTGVATLFHDLLLRMVPCTTSYSTGVTGTVLAPTERRCFASVLGPAAAKHAARIAHCQTRRRRYFCARMPNIVCQAIFHRQADASSLARRPGPQLARHSAVSVAAADVAIRPGFLWRSDAASPSPAAEADLSQPHAFTAADDSLSGGGGSSSGSTSTRAANVEQQTRGDAAAAGLTADCQDVACVIGHFGGAPGSTFASTPPCAECSPSTLTLPSRRRRRCAFRQPSCSSLAARAV